LSRRQPRLYIHHQLFTAVSASEEYEYNFVGPGKLYAAWAESRNGQNCKASIYLRQRGTTAHAIRIQNRRGPNYAQFIGYPIPIDDNYQIFATLLGVPVGDEIQLRALIIYD